jgi:hypothetical protein
VRSRARRATARSQKCLRNPIACFAAPSQRYLVTCDSRVRPSRPKSSHSHLDHVVGATGEPLLTRQPRQGRVELVRRSRGAKRAQRTCAGELCARRRPARAPGRVALAAAAAHFPVVGRSRRSSSRVPPPCTVASATPADSVVRSYIGCNAIVTADGAAHARHEHHVPPAHAAAAGPRANAVIAGASAGRG